MRSKCFESNTPEERIDIFEEYFNRDLDSFFTSSVACCDQCFDNFESDWPGTVAHDVELQNGSIDIKTFLEGSRVQDDFYPEEIAAYSKHLKCPNCGSVLDGRFWIFEHPFSVPQGFNIHEIAQIAQRTPFLLLSHPFARKVYDTIMTLGAVAPKMEITKTYFRARRASGIPNPTLIDFAAPPPAKVGEGRYNHAGHAMLYLAESEGTAIAEMRELLGPVHVATLEMTLAIKCLDLSVSNDVDGETQEIIQCIARSALCATPRASEGWDRPQYIFSRFVADCARSAGIDAIRYGSVNDSSGMNLVLLDPPKDLTAIATLRSVRTAG